MAVHADGSGGGLASPGATTLPADGFDAFFPDAYKMLVKVGLTRGASWHDAQDAASDAMVQVHRYWSTINSPQAYAIRCMINALTQQGVDRQARVAREERATAGRLEGAEDPGMNAWEDQEWVLQILETLPPAQREVMALLVDSLTREEMGDLLGKTPENIRSQLHLARKRLRAYFAELS